MTDKNQEVEEVEADAKVKIAIPTDKYVSAKSASGSASKHNGDAVASALVSQSIDNVLAIAAEVTSIAVDELKAKYAHLNIGQQRMNLGNRIRGAVNKMNKTEEGSGDNFVTTVATGYPLPEPEVKAAKEPKGDKAESAEA